MILALLFLVASAWADEGFFRYAATTGNLLQAFNSAGKLAEVGYDLYPWQEATSVVKGVYLQGAGGVYFPRDFSQSSGPAGEISVGYGVRTGSFAAFLSQGGGATPATGAQWVTHLGMSIVSDKAGIGIELTHMSTGDANSNTGTDMLGVRLDFKL